MRVLADILNEGLLGRQSHRITIKDTVDVLAGDIMEGPERLRGKAISDLYDLLKGSSDAREASGKLYRMKDWEDNLYIAFYMSGDRPSGSFLGMALLSHKDEPDGVYSMLNSISSSGPYNVYPSDTSLSWVSTPKPGFRLIDSQLLWEVYAVKKGSELYDALSDMIIKFYNHKWR